ncbi:MAG TPA: type II CAAX endopeptidase family protein [Thermoanaerobaculia bacterium]|nr:type II CAAX endopeptidase family protein [Thermoanaerobaculia bacterium]
MPAYLPVALIALVWLVIVILNERVGLLSCDRFPNRGAKWFAYLWLGVLMIGLAYLVTGAAMKPTTARDLAKVPFYSLFSLHAVLVIFLVGWWLATGRPSMREFLNIRREAKTEAAAIGLSVGLGGWIFTLMAAGLVALILRGIGLLNEPPQPPPMIGWMAALPIWKKALIVLSAATVEEAFFRSWLQKQIGLIASTILFALAHFTYAQPLLLIGVSVISIVIGITFWRTKNVVPGMIAHGIFDGIQLFVIIPIAFQVVGAG